MDTRQDDKAKYSISRRVLVSGVGALLVCKPALASSAAPKMSGYVGDFYPFDTPQVMPPVHFAGSDNRMHDLTEMTGRIVLLNFWATWCAPCLAELPDLDNLQRRFSSEDFIVLALCEDARNLRTVATYFNRRGVETLGQFMDPTGEALRAYAVLAVPTSFVIDRTGKVRGILPGSAPWDSQEARALITYYLREPQPGRV